jgi:hypothetical protein
VEVGVIADIGSSAVVLPSPPDAVLVLVGGLCFRIQDNSSICKARTAKDKISSGSGEMSKVAGTDWGMKRWKRG